jgi:hypothetical protein
MKKKTAFFLAFLITLTASLSAQVVTYFVYFGNVNEQQFNEAAHMLKMPGWYVTNKLPNPVIQAINNNLRNYSLATGDNFACCFDYQGSYFVILRITDARNSMWQFFAWFNPHQFN